MKIPYLKSLLVGLLLSITSFINSASASVILNIDTDGQLLGASNVNINGALFDVTFTEGRCIELFSGCNDPTDFDFSNQDEATSAAQALLDTVFWDSSLGNFDSDPSLSIGCNDSELCITLVSYAEGFGFVFTGEARNRNQASPFGDIAIGNAYPIFDNTANIGIFQWALFTPVTSVSEPSTLIVLAMGIFGLVRCRRPN